MEPTFRCPVCQGSIAFWVVRTRFRCHHCSRTLSSNVRSAVSMAVLVGALAELALAAGLWLTLASAAGAIGVWLAAGCAVGFVAGWLALKGFMTLAPVSPPNAAASYQPHRRAARS